MASAFITTTCSSKRFQNVEHKDCSKSKRIQRRILAEQPSALPCTNLDRRQVLSSVAALIGASLVSRPNAAAIAADAAVQGGAAPAATIRPELAPDQALYDAADPRLREAAQLLQQALNASSVEEEERLWTELIIRYSGMDEPWVPDIVGRALGNRGNARSRQGKLEAALSDYNASIALCPWSVDPLLNRGVVLEALGRWEEAVRDYDAVLAAAPNDPSGWNNRGNAMAGLGEWAEAARCYGRAAQLAPQFSFAAANQAVALYQLGEENRAIKQMRSLLRRYPEFPDMRAALAAALWGEGLEAQAEEEWQRVSDPRYRDPGWVRTDRRWPPRLAENLRALVAIEDVRQ